MVKKLTLENILIIFINFLIKKNQIIGGIKKKIFFKIFRKYDLSINLTSSDRSVLYAILASKKSISVVEKENKKSWWKKKLLSDFYFYDNREHILSQNYTPLRLLGIKHDNFLHSIENKLNNIQNIRKKLDNNGIDDFVILGVIQITNIVKITNNNIMINGISDIHSIWNRQY